MHTPKSLLEASRLFSNPETAHAYLRDLRWPDGVIPCPVCKSEDHYYLANQRRWKCKLCKKQFSVKVGTIFEDSPLGLDKWLIAVWLITNAKNGISSCEIARALEVTQKSAWFMLHRIRLAMQNGSLEKLMDDVEVDETYIGGKARNMHKHVREQKITGTGGKDKTVVMGMLERGGEVKTQVIARPKKTTLQKIIAETVLPGSRVYTDALKSYDGLNSWFALSPNGTVKENKSGQRLGIWVMPDNKSCGDLEAFLVSMIPPSCKALFDYASSSVTQAKELGAVYKDVHTRKALLYTYLAWQDPPGQSHRVAIKPTCLNPKSKAAKGFIEWFGKLYGLTPKT